VSGPGVFVVVEGGDASGKSTQVERLAARVRASGREVVVTFEPGATALGKQVRELVLRGDDLAPWTEALLIAADRAQHVAEVVEPALARGAVVVSDRHVPSSLAYQGVGRGLGVDAVGQIAAWSTGGLVPDVVVVLDVDDTVATARQHGPLDRVERAGEAFHGHVRAAYRDLAADHGWTLVDGSGEPDDVAERVWAAVAPRLPT
jgi:dTMP kinase